MAEVPKETEQKIAQLQLMEQNLQSFLMQRQQFQSQLVEVESALKELDKSKESYKIVGNIMVSTSKEELKKDLEEKKYILGFMRRKGRKDHKPTPKMMAVPLDAIRAIHNAFRKDVNGIMDSTSGR